LGILKKGSLAMGFFSEFGWRPKLSALVVMGLGCPLACADGPTPDETRPPAAEEAPADEAQAPQAVPPAEGRPGQGAIRVQPNVIRIAPLGQLPGAIARPQMFQIKLSEFWLGIDCTPLHPAMSKHLKLEGDGGLIVEQVMPESPAAKAGFTQHDLLLAAGDKPIATIQQLMEVLDAAKGQPVEFHILRAGDRHKLSATPEKRPKLADRTVPEQPMWVEGEAPKVFSIVRDQLEKGGMPMRIQVFPLGAAPTRAAQALDVPDDLKIHVDKQGKQPAKIVVERGEEKWTVEEDQLDPLPDDVRPHVEAMLDRLFVANPAGDVQFRTNILPGPGTDGPLAERLERRLEEMNRRLEQFRGELDELRKK
jgi:hypothetical protein